MPKSLPSLPLRRTLWLLCAACICFAGPFGCSSGGGSSPPADPADSPDDTPPDPNDDDDGNDDGGEDPPSSAVTVIDSEPLPFAADAEIDQMITVRFSAPLDVTTARSSNVRLFSRQRGLVSARVDALQEGGRLLTIRPDQGFLPGEELRVELSNALQTLDGASFAGETFEFSVRTQRPPAATVRREISAALAKIDQVLAGDLDLDGHQDLVYTVDGGSTIDILLGGGDGSFTPHSRVDAFQTISAVALADVDSDGDLDIVAGTTDRVRVFEADTDPLEDLELDSGVEVPTRAVVLSLAVGEIDHRSGEDLVVLTAGGIEVRLGMFSSPVAQQLDADATPTSNLVLADLDLDGHVDLLYGRSDAMVALHRGSGDASKPFTSRELLDVGVTVQQLRVADVATTLGPEIIALAADSTNGLLRLISSNGTGFSVSSAFGAVNVAADETAGESGRFLLADLDGEGRLDILATSTPSREVLTFDNFDGAAPYAQSGALAINLPAPLAVAVADFTGNGALEYIVASGAELHALLPDGAEPPPPPPPPPGNDNFRLAIDPLELAQGATDRAVVRLTNTAGIEGYSAAIEFDPAVLTPIAEDFSGTVTGDVAPEFSTFSVNETFNFCTVAVLIDFLPPFDQRTIPPGTDQLLFRVELQSQVGAALGNSPLTIRPKIGDPEVSTTLVVGGLSVEPELLPGVVTIVSNGEPPVIPDGDALSFAPLTVAPGASAPLQVIGSLEQSADGYTVIGSFDPALFQVLEVTAPADMLATLAPELTIPKIDAENGLFFFTVIFDFLPPFERQAIPAGDGQVLAEALLSARDTTPVGDYSVQFVDGAGDPPLNNIFVYDGQSVFPQLVPGVISVGDGSASGELFVRGDFDGDGSLTLTDAVAISNYLFLQGAEPQCSDAADVDDNGEVNVTDTVGLLNFTSGVGSPPPEPYPEEGTDPTLDELDCN